MFFPDPAWAGSEIQAEGVTSGSLPTLGKISAFPFLFKCFFPQENGPRTGRSGRDGSLFPYEKGPEPVFPKCEGLIDLREHSFPVLGQSSLEVKVVAVVVAGYGGAAHGIFQERPGFPEYLVGGEDLEKPLFHLMEEQGIDLGDQGAQPYKIGSYGGNRLGGTHGMLQASIPSPEAQEHIFTQFHPGLLYKAPGQDLFPGGGPLFDPAEHLIVPAFKAHVYAVKSRLSQGLEFPETFPGDIPRRAVDRDPFQGRKLLPCETADRGEILRGHGYGISRRQEQGLDTAPVYSPGLLDVPADIRDGPDPEWRALLVDHAEGALVVGTPDCCLDQETVRLAGRPVYGTFVVQGESSDIIDRQSASRGPSHPGFLRSEGTGCRP